MQHEFKRRGNPGGIRAMLDLPRTCLGLLTHRGMKTQMLGIHREAIVIVVGPLVCVRLFVENVR